MKGLLKQATPWRFRRAPAAGGSLAIILALAAVCGAGEIQKRDWPCNFKAQTIPILEVPVVMDLEVVYAFTIFGDAIRLQRVDERTYRGCTTLMVSCTFDLTLFCTIEPTGAMPGDYSCSIDTPEISAPFGTAQLCAEVRNARLDNLPADRKALRVATIKIRVLPK